MAKTAGRRLLAILGAAAILGSGIVVPFTGTQTAEAAPLTKSAVVGSQFDPGHIISDELFFNGSAMSEAEIQAFLVSQVPGACGGAGCLKNHVQHTSDKPQYYSSTSGRVECLSYPGAVGESAARIIFKVQQLCGVSAKVLLVTLQKERGLVQKASPIAADYTVAMGMGCPDTAACDANYFGFFNQVWSAARQFKAYRASPQSFNFRAGITANVGFHPNAACGSSPVFLQNAATAALYNYTPYQPNPAALANLGGTGDGCSSYGNRNFWVFYNTWFGPTTPAVGSPVGQLKDLWATPNAINMWGWAVDPTDVMAALDVHILLDGQWFAWTADAPTNGAPHFPGAGLNHNFGGSISVEGGRHNLCVTAKNVGIGSDLVLSCGLIDVPEGSPAGVMHASGSSEGVAVWGWAADRDSTDRTVDVHVRVGDATWASMRANKPLPEASAVVPGGGTSHGWGGLVAVPAGNHEVCAWAKNTGAGFDTSLGCSTVVVPPKTGISYGAVAAKDSSGRPIPGVQVELRAGQCDGPPVWRNTTQSTAGSVGAFGISVEAGAYCAVTTSVPLGYTIPEPVTVNLPVGVGNWVTVWLPSVVTGAVVAKDASGIGVNGVTAVIKAGSCADNGAPVWRQTTATDRWSSGGFGISLAPGTYCSMVETAPAGFDVPSPVETWVSVPGPVWITLWMPRAL